jgi:AraC-like DNA-binding protein
MGMQDLSPFQRVRISTADFPEHKRLAMWREIYGRGVTNCDIEPLHEIPFRADVAFSLLPDLTIVAGSRTPATYRVTRELAGRGKDVVALSILRSGRATATQFDKELIGGVGSASVLMSSDPSASTMLSEGSFVTLAMDRTTIGALVPNLSEATGHSIRSDNPALRLLIRYLDAVQAATEFENRAIARAISSHILDLAALSLGAGGDVADLAQVRGVRAARLDAIRSDIRNNLGRGELSVEEIAARHGISPRYVRKLFWEEGSSFSVFLLEERLQQARRMLGDRRYAHLNIARVAHEAGFNDISYFNRTFRRRFLATPSDIREAARIAWGE